MNPARASFFVQVSKHSCRKVKFITVSIAADPESVLPSLPLYSCYLPCDVLVPSLSSSTLLSM